jgi:integrase/recombinase XerC/integrase/recombinase XerD
MSQLIETPQAVTHQRPVQSLLNEFIDSQDISQSSRATYKRTLQQYFNWIEQTGRTLQTIELGDLITYKEDLLTRLTALTVSSYITSLRKFYEWAEAKKYYPNIARGLKAPRRKHQFKKQPLQIDDSKALLSHYEYGSRDYALVNLLLRTGLRTIEIARADIGDITYKAGKRILKVHGKGRDEKDGLVVLTRNAWEPLQAYINTRNDISPEAPLFTSTANNNAGGRLTTRTVSAIVKTGLRAIGLDSKEFSAHSLRHTTAVNILRAGGSIQNAQDVLRHASPATTQIYTATIHEELRLKDAPEELLDTLY